ncbi:Holliday junction branch migration protein RuvA [Pelagibacterium montanilacus]|uniref:Holliday junction branch migration protein RuvA n=1 Tax=Pelagibacterium montanilacus TaxID=2185280 RepID=UPI000F8EFB6E|nr:Holliday junction branch migration protein RuvA [Pelagibacterium montanilacus]
MIGKLKGLLETVGEDHALIDVGGVCYEVFCSTRTLEVLPATGEPASVFVEMIVREDMIRLYGFSGASEKGWFRLLLSVQGVGARVALGILSTLSPSDLSSAISLQDKAMVGRAPGVGPKLAQRIVSELKGKMPAHGAIDSGVAGLQNALGEGIAASNLADAVSALVNLGYGQSQSSSAVARVVAREGQETSTEKLIRLGLKELSS